MGVHTPWTSMYTPCLCRKRAFLLQEIDIHTLKLSVIATLFPLLFIVGKPCVDSPRMPETADVEPISSKSVHTAFFVFKNTRTQWVKGVIPWGGD